MERSKNRVTLTQFKRYVAYFKEQLLNSKLDDKWSEDGQKGYTLQVFRKEIFGLQPEFYEEALWIFEQVFQLQQGTEAYEDGDYYTNHINLDDTMEFLTRFFPSLSTGLMSSPSGGIHRDTQSLPVEKLTLRNIGITMSERSSSIMERKTALPLEQVIDTDIKRLNGDHEIFKDEFEQFKHILGVESNSSAKAFFNLIRNREKTVTWKQIASLLKFLEDMKDNIEVAIRDEENCPRAEDEDPTVGELKTLLKIYSDDHAKWLFKCVSERHSDKITWLEIRDYLGEWDDERGTITGHFENQPATHVNGKHIVSQLEDILSAVNKIQLHCHSLPDHQKGLGIPATTLPTSKCRKSRNRAESHLRLSQMNIMQPSKVDPPRVFVFGSGEEICGASSTNPRYVVISLLDMRSKGEVHRNVTLVGPTAESSGAFLEKDLKALYYGLDQPCTSQGEFIVTLAGDVKFDPAYVSVFQYAGQGDIAFLLSMVTPPFIAARSAMSKGLHVISKTYFTNPQLEELLALAKRKNRLFAFYRPLRYQQEYLDARKEILRSGDLLSSHLSSTIRCESTGKDDILLVSSFHQLDFHVWCLEGKAEPVEVTAVANTSACSVTIVVKWMNVRSKSTGVATYSECWGPEVEPRYRFFHVGTKKTVEVDLGVNFSAMNYRPDSRRRFVGQGSSHYQALKDFIDSVKDVKAERTSASGFETVLPTAASDDGRIVCRILDAARFSLYQKKPVAFGKISSSSV